MSSLVLEVLSNPDHLPIARAKVPGISRLSLSHPISGFYTLVSPTSEKLGELQASENMNLLKPANCFCVLPPASYVWYTNFITTVVFLSLQILCVAVLAHKSEIVQNTKLGICFVFL